MRAGYLCAIALCATVLVAQYAESSDLPGASVFSEVVQDVVQPFEDIEESLFEEEAAPVTQVAKAYSECEFQGNARDTGTPMVVTGHNNIASLKVPAGQCAALFSLEGFNDGHTGEMLSIRGPMDVPCLNSYQLRDGTASWLEATMSYKLGPCDATPTEDMATAAVTAAAKSAPDLNALAHAAKKAAEGQFGSITSSYTKSDRDTGVAKPYDWHKVVQSDAQFLGDGVETSSDSDSDSDGAKVVAGAGTVEPYPYADHKSVEDADAIEHDPEPAPTPPPTVPSYENQGSGGGSVNYDFDKRPASGSALFKWEHEHLGKEAWKKFHIPFPNNIPKPEPFKESNDIADDADDLAKEAAKNSVGCDPMLGCRQPPPPCVDRDTPEICADYVRNGDCQYDFVMKDCKKSCDLCPKNEGSIASDAYVGPGGHYYLGSARRRVGAGFGRRRRSPVVKKEGKKKGGITAPKPPTKEEKKVPASILHADGKKTVEVKDPNEHNGIDCEKCSADFAAADGCNIWKSGGDPTNVVKKGCEPCAEAAAKHCGMSTTAVSAKDADATIPKPIEHPKTAAKILVKAADNGKKEVEKEVPKAVADAVKTDLKKAGAEPPKTDTVGGATGSGAAVPAAKPTKEEAEAAAETAVADSVKAAAAGSAATAATGSAAAADETAVKAEAAVAKAEEAPAATPDTPAVKAAETKAATAQAAATTADAAATSAQAVDNKAAATAEQADTAADAADSKQKMEPISALPETPAEVENTEANDWASDELKKAEQNDVF